MSRKSICLLISICMMANCVLACEKQPETSEDVIAVEELIGEIGNVDENSGEAIAEAQEAYDDLSPAERRDVENRDVLDSVIDEYNSLPIGIWACEYTADCIYDYYVDGESVRVYGPGDEVQYCIEINDGGSAQGVTHNLTSGVTNEESNYTWSIDFEGIVTLTNTIRYNGGAPTEENHEYRLVNDNGQYELVSCSDPNSYYTRIDN